MSHVPVSLEVSNVLKACQENIYRCFYSRECKHFVRLKLWFCCHWPSGPNDVFACQTECFLSVSEMSKHGSRWPPFGLCQRRQSALWCHIKTCRLWVSSALSSIPQQMHTVNCPFPQGCAWLGLLIRNSVISYLPCPCLCPPPPVFPVMPRAFDQSCPFSSGCWHVLILSC